jgi:hypothetical protein
MVFEQSPYSTGLHPKHQISYNRFTGQLNYSPLYIPDERDLALDLAIIEIAQSSGAIVINAPQEMGLCADGLVRTRSDDNKLLFRDGDRLRPFFVIENATFIDKLIK